MRMTTTTTIGDDEDDGGGGGDDDEDDDGNWLSPFLNHNKITIHRLERGLIPTRKVFIILS